MRIAYIVPSLQAFGPAIVVLNLTKQLIAMGHDVDVFYFDERESAMSFGCKTIRIEKTKLIDFDSYDIVHSHCLRPDMYVAKWRKTIHKAKKVSTLHQDTYATFIYEERGKLMSKLFTWFWCKIQSKFDSVISISDLLQEIYKSKICTPITTLYNGCNVEYPQNVDERLVQSIKKLRQNYVILGTCAYVKYRKGLDMIISILPTEPNYAFVIIGDGPEKPRLQELAKDLKVDDRVLFCPHQNAPQNYHKYFDIYVMPSRSEGFGLAMVEAALEHKSIVCSNLSSFKEIFPNQEASFFELENPDSLKEAINNAYLLRETLGEKAYDRCINNFTAKKMAENHLKHYQSLLNE